MIHKQKNKQKWINEEINLCGIGFILIKFHCLFISVEHFTYCQYHTDDGLLP